MSLICQCSSLLDLRWLTYSPDYIPVYFQVCKGAGPIRSSIDTFPIAFVLPVSSMLSGVTIKLLRKYRPSNYIGWALMMLGFGLLSLLKEDASTEQWVCFQGIVGAGVGIVWTGIVFPILAPLPVKRIASALGFFNFGRTFAQVCGAHCSLILTVAHQKYSGWVRRGG